MSSTPAQLKNARNWREKNLEKAREACRKWRKNNPEKQAAACLGWKNKNPGKHEALTRAYRAANPNKTRDWAREWRARNPDYSYKKYGLTKEGFDKLKIEQGGKCKICDLSEKLLVDHCHTTKKIRGLLCHNCNVSLGLMKDSFENLIRAADYIRRLS